MRTKQTHRTLMLGTLALTLFVAFTMSACGGNSGNGSTDKGSDRDAYSAEDLNTGEPVSVSSFKGKPVLLVSWATWCRNCDEELSRLQAFQDSSESDGIAVVAVNLDAASVEEEIAAKVERHKLTVDLWRDPTNDFKRNFGALGVPTTVLIDSTGEVAETFPGVVDFSDAKVIAAIDRARQA